MEILPELLVVGASKEKRKVDKDKTIKKGDKSLKRFLIILAKIQTKESMTSLSKMIQDYLAKTIKKTLLLKF